MGEVGTRVSFETSFDSKQPKLEPKLVSALSETKRLFRLFRFYIEIASFVVSIKTEPTKTIPCPVPGRVCSKAARNCLVCCLRTCLSYSNLSAEHKPVLQPELPLKDVSLLQQPAASGHIFYTAAFVLPRRVFSTEAYAASDLF